MAKERQKIQQSYRAVKEKLTEDIAAQLHVDIEADSSAPWKYLKLKRPVYKGPQSQACRNRFRYLHKLKKENPLTYWKLYAETNLILDSVNRSPAGYKQEDKSAKQESEEEDDGDLDEDSDDEEDSEEEEPKRIKQTSQKENASLNFQSPTSRSKMAPPGSVGGSASGRGGSVRSGTPVKKKNLYSSLEDVQNDADEVVEVDFDYPERNGAPTFFVQLTDSVPVDTNGTKELVSQVKVHLNHLVDLADFGTLTATLVAEGRALLVKVPVLPHFRRNAHHVKAAYKLEQNPCVATNNEYQICVNAILADEKRLYKKYLFVWPDDMVCSTRMQSDSPPTADEKIQIKLRKLPLVYTVGKQNVDTVYYPGFWLLRVISDTKKVLEEAEVEVVNELDDLFGGMTVDDDDDSMN
jgi:hypothetical protein